MRTLVAGTGYTNLRDLSAGLWLLERLAAETWPVDVEVRDAGFGSVQVALDWQAAQAEAPFGRAVVFGAISRGRPPGSVICYRWDGVLPDPGLIQAHVGEAVTGTISLDALLIIARQFQALPDEVTVVEIEPEDEGWGPGFSFTVQAALPGALDAIRQAILAPDPAAPRLPLGGGVT